MGKRSLTKNEERIFASFHMNAAQSFPQLDKFFATAIDDGQRRVIQIFVMLPDDFSIVSEEADKLRDLAEAESEKENYPISLRCTHEPKGLYGKKEDYARLDPIEAALHKQLRRDKRIIAIGEYSRVYWIAFWLVFIILLVYGIVVNTPR